MTKSHSKRQRATDDGIPLLVSKKYRLVKRIAAGGMGDVFAGVNRLTNERVAIKVLRSAEDAKQVQRFEQEAQFAKEIRHKNLCEVIGYGVSREKPYLVMPLLEGISLADLIAHYGAVDPYRAVDITCQTLAALQALHDAAVMHRDLKPSNVFVVRRKSEDVVKVLDLGVSRSVNRSLTRKTTGNVSLGTPHYMAPERLHREGTIKSDIYAVGIILYEILTSIRPYDGSLVEVCDQISAAQSFKKPGHVNPLIPPGVEQVVMTAMARDPSERYASADEMRLALEQAPMDRAKDNTAETADITHDDYVVYRPEGFDSGVDDEKEVSSSERLTTHDSPGEIHVSEKLRAEILTLSEPKEGTTLRKLVWIGIACLALVVFVFWTVHRFLGD